jgi:hypothetical protein
VRHTHTHVPAAHSYSRTVVECQLARPPVHAPELPHLPHISSILHFLTIPH